MVAVKGKKAKVFKLAAVCALFGCLAAGLCLNVYQIRKTAEQDGRTNRFIESQLERQAKENEQENTYQEDGFVISGNYKIASTKQISDAYLSGGASGLSGEDQETLQMAAAVLGKIVKENMTNYEKELAVYDWMCANIRHANDATISLPRDGSDSSRPYGVLKNKTAMCVGYATTFRLFMNMLGMDVHIVHNDYHSWDLVEVEKGQWYHVDIYSDSDDSGSGRYADFNITDSMAKLDNEWDASALPAADCLDYNYAVMNAKTIDDVFALPREIKQAAKKIKKKEKKSTVFFRFKKELEQKDWAAVEFICNRILEAAMAAPSGKGYSLTYKCYPDRGERFIVGIFISRYEEDANPAFIDESSKMGKKLLKLISKYFGPANQ